MGMIMSNHINSFNQEQEAFYVLDDRVGQVINFESNKEMSEYYKLTPKVAPIDTVWQSSMMWAGLSDKPILCAVKTPDNLHYYVLTKTRVFTYATFFACVGKMKWNMNLSPSVINSLFDETVKANLLAPYFEYAIPENVGRISRQWYNHTLRELGFNCSDWLSKTPNEEILSFLEINNVAQTVEIQHPTRRKDGFKNVFPRVVILPDNRPDPGVMNSNNTTFTEFKKAIEMTQKFFHGYSFS